MKNIISKLRKAWRIIGGLDLKFDEVKLNQGLILAELHRQKASTDIQDYEFKVFSQWGEDGIIQHLVACVEIKHKTFIEFGVEDFFEANCRFLLMKDNWRGLVIDGSPSHIERLSKSYFFWKHNLNAIDAFITKDNINELLARSGFDRDLGILSIDLDGNDFFILEAIDHFQPRILICEYNAVFGATRKITVPYAADFVRGKHHYSNLYAGASLGAIDHLAQKKGYALVGTNRARNNAFFVRSELLNDRLRELSVEDAYAPSEFREGLDESGQFSFLAGEQRLDLIKGLPVFNVQTGSMETL